MKNSLFTKVAVSILFLTSFTQIKAQFYLPVDQGLYGGQIRGITAGTLQPADQNGDQISRLFVATLSINQAFYADIVKNNSDISISKFKVVPGLVSTSIAGLGIRDMGYHPESGYLFFTPVADQVSDAKVYKVNTESDLITTTIPVGVFSFKLEGDYLLALGKGIFYFGTINSDGTYNNLPGSPISIPELNIGYDGDRENFPQVIVSKEDSVVYLFKKGQTPRVFEFSVPYYSMDGTTTYSEIDLSPITATTNWRICGVGYDGRLFLGGRAATTDVVSYTDNRVQWTSESMNVSVGNSPCFGFSKSNQTYYVCTAAAYNSDKGQAEWKFLGYPGGLPPYTETNSEAVYTHPDIDGLVFLELRGSFGFSTDYGSSFSECIDGLEAVNVYKFKQFDEKDKGWLATSSGFRKVSGYNTETQRYTKPNMYGGGGSVSVDVLDTAIVYFGRGVITKTTDGGISTSDVFTPTQEPFNFLNSGQTAEIAICPYDDNIVFAGYNMKFYHETVAYGGLFYTMDSKNIFMETWDQLLLNATEYGYDVDINDLAFNIENNDTVLYAAATYYPTNPSGGKNVYRIVKNGSHWIAAQDMTSQTMSDGLQVIASIEDLELSTSGDTLYAAGFDELNGGSVIYRKNIAGDNKWEKLTQEGLDWNGFNPRVALGNDTLYFSLENRLYFLDLSSDTWQIAYTYPPGSETYFLLYDALVAGTNTGFYAMESNPSIGINEFDDIIPDKFILSQNYPNPFNPTTRIRYSVPSQTYVKIKVYDIIGNLVKVLVDDIKPAGNYEVAWDGKNSYNESVATGVYIYRIETENFIQAKKMLLLK